MKPAIKGDILLTRKLKMGTINDLRKATRKKKYKTFEELTKGNKRMAQNLKQVYQHIDNVEGYVGTMCESSNPDRNFVFHSNSFQLRGLMNTALLVGVNIFTINAGECNAELVADVLDQLKGANDDKLMARIIATTTGGKVCDYSFR